MKFREEDGLTAKVITASTPLHLEEQINNLGEVFELIDLQYSTTGENTYVEYSALALVRTKKVK